jgi:hypothetical protein
MRILSLLLIGLGVIGLILGTITFIGNMRAPGMAPFSMENYGGPGPILGALFLLLGGLYLFSSFRREG